MPRSPYRVAAEGSVETIDNDDGCASGDLFAVMAIFWVGSIARVVLGASHQETFGVEPTLAVLAVALVPFLLKERLAWYWRRLRPCSSQPAAPPLSSSHSERS